MRMGLVDGGPPSKAQLEEEMAKTQHQALEARALGRDAAFQEEMLG